MYVSRLPGPTRWSVAASAVWLVVSVSFSIDRRSPSPLSPRLRERLGICGGQLPPPARRGELEAEGPGQDPPGAPRITPQHAVGAVEDDYVLAEPDLPSEIGDRDGDHPP